MFSLEFTGIIDPRFYVSYTLGAIIFVLGFFKLLHKGHIMDVKYKMEEKQAAKGEELKKRNKSLASKGSKSKRQSSTHRLSVAMDKRASGASYSSNGSPSSAGSSSSSDTLDSSLSDSSPISPLVSPASSKIKNTTSKKKTSLSKKSRK